MNVALLGYYTITPTHCGTGQAVDAVDLPIAREGHTKHPILPATSLKGAIRAAFEASVGRSNENIKGWFGPDLSETKPGESGGRELRAGSITFGEGRLLAFPVRALHTSFCYVTCPLILSRLERDLRAYGLDGFWNGTAEAAWHESSSKEAHVSSWQEGQPLVLEDLVFGSREFSQSPDVVTVAKAFASLLPENEKTTKKRLEAHCVVLRDDLFNDLVRRTTPIQARIHLNDNKTTTGGGGNLWYEEALPADALFASFVGTRRQTHTGSAAPKGTAGTPDPFLDQLSSETARPLQIGGNETVGQGLCLWRVALTR